MQSSSLLNEGTPTPLGSEKRGGSDKSEMSKQLFAQINWQEILRAGVFLSHKDHQLLERAQANLNSVTENEEDCKLLCSMMIKIAENCTNNLSIQQYAFLRIEELLGLTGDIESGGDVAIKRAPYFANDKGEVPPTSFLRGIRSIDQMVQKSAACGYACLLVHLQGDVSTFINWLLDLFKTAVLETILPPLCMIMRKDEARTIFAKAHGVNLLVSQLYKLGVNGNSQQIYELSFCLWTISLSKDIDQQAFLSSGAIRILSDLLASAPSRKVVRMSLAILHNLANLENEDIVTEMLTSGLQRLLESLSKSNAFIQGGDSDMEADVKALSEVLLKNFRELSTFDRWVSEVHSGALRWGVVHTEKFWRENSKLLEADDFKLLKKIISLLHSDDPVIVTIALYDMGEFTRFYPNGRGITRSLGGKDIAMQMIDHANLDIQKAALQCVSKVMVTNWEFMK